MWQFPLTLVDREWSDKKQRDAILTYLSDELKIGASSIIHHSRDICQVRTTYETI